MTIEDIVIFYENCDIEESSLLYEALKKEGYDGVLVADDLIMNFTNVWPDTLLYILKFNTGVII